MGNRRGGEGFFFKYVVEEKRIEKERERERERERESKLVRGLKRNEEEIQIDT